MKVRILQPIERWMKYVHLMPGQIADMPDADAEKLIRAKLAEPVEPETGGASAAGVVGAPSSAGQPSPQAPPAGEEEGGETQREEQPSALISPPSPAPSPFLDQVVADPRLLTWLNLHGFKRLTDKPVYVKIVKVEEEQIARLVVSFEHNPWGNRYGYVLDETTGEWKPDPKLRDHPELLEYKKFRDQLRQAAETKVEMRRETKEVEVAPGQVQQLEVVQVMETRDEEQILQELSRSDFASEVVSQYFYEFTTKDGRHVIGLSYKGVKQLILKHGGIETERPERLEAGDKVIYLVRAKDKIRDITAWGVGTAPRDAPFAEQLALAKAQRNCWRVFLPETIISEAYRRWKERREL
ncbi:MAG: hypothetical protein QXR87_05235 [Candidatus Hadarchaeales archaeon]